MEIDEDIVNGKNRIIISEVIMENFKSYSGIKRVGPFHQNFSAIIGPNGSGKSNVIDALLFVFGKRAKKLRLKRVCELIYNSNAREKFKSAKVTVKFQQIQYQDLGETIKVVREFEISRIAYDNSKSEYFLNGRNMSLTEVVEFLKEQGVDMNHNRFLILQGEVEQISQMKPKTTNQGETGLLEYLEEIIGSDIYIEPIYKASQQLDETCGNKDIMVRRIKALSKERESIRVEKEKAELYLKKEAQITKIKIQQLKQLIEKIQEKEGLLRKKAEVMKDQLSSGGREIKALEEKRKVEEDKLKNVTLYISELREMLNSLNNAFATFDCEDIKIRTELQNMSKEYENIYNSINSKSKENHICKTEKEELELRAPLVESELNEISKELYKQQQVLSEIKENCRVEMERYQEQLTAAEFQLAPLERKAVEIREEINSTESKRSGIINKNKGYEENLEEAKREIKEEKTKLEKLDEFLKNTKVLRSKAIAEIQEIQNNIRNAKEKEKELEEKLQKENAAVESASEIYNKQRSQGEKIRLINEARTSGKIKGIYGRLGDLGAVDAIYDIAISNSRSSALNHIVVETIEDAQKCGNLLKEARLGVTTFLVRNKQEHFFPHALRVPLTPEGVPRLFDCVRVTDEKLKVAFYSVLREMLVTKDLDQAARIAYRNNTISSVVTLKGEVISAMGTMTGGGKQLKRGLICVGDKPPAFVDSSQALQQVESSKQQKIKLNEELSRIKEEIGKLFEKLDALKSEVKKYDAEIKKTEIEIKTSDDKIKDFEKIANDFGTRQNTEKENGNILRELDRKLEDLRYELINREEAMKPMKKCMKQINLNIENIGDGIPKNQKSLVEEISRRLKNKEEEMASNRAVLESKIKQIFNSQKSLEQLSVNKEETEAKINNSKEKIKEIDERAIVTRRSQKETKSKIKIEEDNYKNLKQICVEQNEAINKMRQKEAKVQLEYENLMEDLAKERNGIENFEKNLNSLIEHYKKCSPDDYFEFGNDERIDEQEARQKIQKLTDEKSKIENPDLSAIDLFKAKEVEIQKNQMELDSLNLEISNLSEEFENLRYKRLSTFKSGFNKINHRLKEVYRSITDGGDIELEAIDSFDPFSEGIDFEVRPPRKSWKKMRFLSGGERTLSSLSLIFALHSFKPTPFYIMDEIDAALDFRNVAIVGKYITERTRDAQFIVVSLRTQMFSLSRYLIGIYKVANCTYSAMIDQNGYYLQNTKTSDNHLPNGSGNRKRSLSVSSSEVTKNMRRLSLVIQNDESDEEETSNKINVNQTL